MKIYIRHGNPTIDKLDRIGVTLEDYESYYTETTIENMGHDLYNAIKSGELTNHSVFSIEIIEDYVGSKR